MRGTIRCGAPAGGASRERSIYSPRLSSALFRAARNREITGARADVQLGALLFGQNLHAAEAVISRGLGGVIADGVLAANVARHLGCDLVHLLQRTGKVCDAAGL